MNKTILITIFTAVCAVSVLADEPADEAVVGKWKYKAGILDFKPDGTVDASYDDKTYRKWSKADRENTYYFIIPSAKLTLILSKDGNSFDMVERKRIYKRLGTEKPEPKVKKLTTWQFFSRVIWDKVGEVRACLENQPEMAQAKERGDITALHKVKSREMVELLILHNADVNAKNSFENTPLHYAYTNKEVAVVLIENGGDVHSKNGAGYTPLTKALKEGTPDVVEVMLNSGGEMLSDKEWSSMMRSVKRPDMKGVVVAYNSERQAKAAQEKAAVNAIAKAEAAKARAENMPPPLKLEETMVAKESATFKITDVEIADRKDILRDLTRSKNSLLSEGDWENLPTLIAVTFELDIENAEPGKVSTFMIKKIYVQVGRRKYPFIGLRLDNGTLYQGPGITFHSDQQGNFELSKKPKTTMFFLVPEGTPQIKLIFNDKVVAQAML